MSGQSAGGREPVHREFLERRNALWASLRKLEPGSSAFEDTSSELSALIGWNRARILAGLGLLEQDVPDAKADAGPKL